MQRPPILGSGRIVNVREPGRLYEIEMVASAEGRDLGADRTFLYAAPGNEEYFDPGMRAPLLERLARDDGSFYEAYP